MHVDTPGQDTQNNWPVGASGFGLGTFAHPDPDALAPAGTASAVAVTATETMTAKKTRNRTGRMGPPPSSTRLPVRSRGYWTVHLSVAAGQWRRMDHFDRARGVHGQPLCLPGWFAGLLHSLTGAKYP